MSITATVLGCGPSGGVPLIGCNCRVCTSADPKNKRLRSSVMVEQGEHRVLIDTSPDLRAQALKYDIKRVDGILYTHAHADHLHGIDDARAFNYHTGQPVAAYANADTAAEIARRFDYALGNVAASGVWYKPAIRLNTIDEHDRFEVATISVQPFLQYHGKGKSLGYRFGNFAYSTDVDNLPDRSLQLLEKLDVWLVDCLQYEPAPTHAHLAKTLEWIEKVKPKRAVLTHMTHAIDYAELKAKLPPYIEPAYDGMSIAVSE